MARKKITVGDFLDPKPEDEEWETLADAREAAELMSDHDDNLAVAVWNGDDLDRVFLRGFELEPV